MSDSDQSSIDSNLTQSLNTLLEKSSEELYNEAVLEKKEGKQPQLRLWGGKSIEEIYNEAMLEKKEGKHRQNEDESMLDEPGKHHLSSYNYAEQLTRLQAEILEEMKIKAEADASDNITLQAEIKE